MQSQDADEVLGALADERRRLVIRYLSNDAAGTVSVRELAEHVASRTDEPSRDVMINLQHAVLPLLAERNLVEYDPESGVVQYRSDPLVEEVLQSVPYSE